MQLDQNQIRISQILDQMAQTLKPKSFVSNFHKYFQQNKQPYKGLYLYGSVGSGKTMLMQKFLSKVKVPSQIVHYQDFMLKLHQKFHKTQAISKDRAIEALANEIAKEYQLLCIDEFEINDITDAMLIMRLFEFLIQRNIFLFVTTNTKPCNLYKDGIARSSFLPFIDLIQSEFNILELDAKIDYRFTNILAVEQRIIYPKSQENNTKILAIKDKLCDKSEITADKLTIFGRDIHFTKTHQNILFTNFKELCEQNFSYADYVHICQNYNIIVLENVPIIQENETDLIIRFINFIDNAYFCKLLLFISLDQAPENIYKEGRKTAEFKRTISRLNEMNNANYLKND